MRKLQIPKKFRVNTTVRLKKVHIDILKQTAKEIGLSMNDLMLLLLRYANERLSLLPKFSLIKYQKSEKDSHPVNLYMGAWDYEKNLDARLYARVSVSWHLAYSIDNYLQEILKVLIK